jgi:phosphatidylglycerophosphatase A
MKPNTDTPAPDAPPSEAPEAAPRKKPRLALFLATVFGAGYAPKAPGTFGSLVGVALSIAMTWLGARHILSLHGATDTPTSFWGTQWIPTYFAYVVALAIAALGVYASHRVAIAVGEKDPPYVVIDEVSGQLLTYYLSYSPVYWKSWLLGFILFRVFDIWKPFPVRQLEKLPGGWGIMADDWMAAVYAALVLRLVLHLGLI